MCLYFCFAQINPILLSEVYDVINEYTLHLTYVKIDDPKVVKICLYIENETVSLSWYISKSFYRISTSWGVKI